MDRQKFEMLLLAFDNSDHQTITEAFTNSATWEILGHWTMNGKEEIRKFFGESDIEVIESVRERVIFTGDHAVVESRGKITPAAVPSLIQN
ncbi:MAG: nuclear transport factor 2 family protein [Chitinophagaceae bacterium]|nr:MAG: nuclear transport factor 2 family protein [Chitinophagaceae bacterium]